MKAPARLARRSRWPRPCWAVVAVTRATVRATGSPSAAAMRRASSSAWSKPRIAPAPRVDRDPRHEVARPACGLPACGEGIREWSREAPFPAVLQRVERGSDGATEARAPFELDRSRPAARPPGREAIQGALDGAARAVPRSRRTGPHPRGCSRGTRAAGAGRGALASIERDRAGLSRDRLAFIGRSRPPSAVRLRAPRSSRRRPAGRCAAPASRPAARARPWRRVPTRPRLSRRAGSAAS